MSVLTKPVSGVPLWSRALLFCALCVGNGASAWAREAPPASASKAKPAPSTDALFKTAVKALESCKDGEHFRSDCTAPVFAQLTQAAQAGHAGAQFKLGSLQFSMRFQKDGVDEGSPADHAAYVQALTWIARAAHAGHAKARSFLPPDVTQVLLTGTAAALEPPFGGLPMAWLIEAAKAARPKNTP